MHLLEKTKYEIKNLTLKYSFVHRVHQQYIFSRTFKKMVALAEQIEKIPFEVDQIKNWQIDLKKNRFGFNKSEPPIIEINNTCNIDCRMCMPSLSNRNKGAMQEEILELAIQRFKEYYDKNLFSLHTLGEPLVSTKSEKIFKVFRKYGVRADLCTNGLLLHKHISTLEKYRDVCDKIRFSIDGASKSVYEKIRTGGKWEVLLDNLNLARKQLLPKGFKIVIKMVLSKDNYHELGNFIVFFRQYVASPYRDLQINIISSLSPDNTYFNEKKLFDHHIYFHRFCPVISSANPSILIDGKLSVCYRDYDESLVVGDIHSNSLEEIFRNSQELKNLRKAHENNNFKGYSLCSNCFIVDIRIIKLFNYFFKNFLYWFPNAKDNFYQEKFNQFREIFDSNKDLEKK